MENSSQVPFTERDYVIDTFTPGAADEPLTMSIGLRRPRRRLQDLETESFQALVKRGREDRVTVVNEVAVIVLPGKGFAELLDSPLCGGMLGDVEVEDAARAGLHHDQDAE